MENFSKIKKLTAIGSMSEIETGDKKHKRR